MRHVTTFAVAIIAATRILCQADHKSAAETAIVPFGIPLYATKGAVASTLSGVGKVQNVAAAEGAAMAVYVTNVVWNSVAFDTLFVHFNAAGKTNAVTLVRACDDDKVPIVVGEITDAVARTFGEPTFSDDVSARWERGGDAMVSMGPYNENDAVWLRFDLVPLFQRRHTTRPVWPLAIPSTADRDEVADVLRDSCKKVTDDENIFTSNGCSCFGVKAKRTNVTLDATGRIATIEMIVGRADRASALKQIALRFGNPNGPDPDNPIWMVEEGAGILVSDTDEGVSFIFDIVTLELLQYMQG